MSGMYRIYTFLGELLDLIQDEKWAHVPGAIALIAQAVLQVALDGGSWDVAALMVPFRDPLRRLDFGGEPELLEDIATYKKALAELRAKLVAAASVEAPGDGEEPPRRASRRGQQPAAQAGAQEP